MATWNPNMLYSHGLDEENYQRLVDRQLNKSGELLCPLCFRAGSLGRRMYLFRDRETGIVRGLLCPRCLPVLHQHLAESHMWDCFVRMHPGFFERDPLGDCSLHVARRKRLMRKREDRGRIPTRRRAERARAAEYAASPAGRRARAKQRRAEHEAAAEREIEGMMHAARRRGDIGDV